MFVKKLLSQKYLIRELENYWFVTAQVRQNKGSFFIANLYYRGFSLNVKLISSRVPAETSPVQFPIAFPEASPLRQHMCWPKALKTFERALFILLPWTPAVRKPARPGYYHPEYTFHFFFWWEKAPSCVRFVFEPKSGSRGRVQERCLLMTGLSIEFYSKSYRNNIITEIRLQSIIKWDLTASRHCHDYSVQNSQLELIEWRTLGLTLRWGFTWIKVKFEEV